MRYGLFGKWFTGLGLLGVLGASQVALAQDQVKVSCLDLDAARLEISNINIAISLMKLGRGEYAVAESSHLFDNPNDEVIGLLANKSLELAIEKNTKRLKTAVDELNFFGPKCKMKELTYDASENILTDPNLKPKEQGVCVELNVEKAFLKQSVPSTMPDALEGYHAQILSKYNVGQEQHPECELKPMYVNWMHRHVNIVRARHSEKVQAEDVPGLKLPPLNHGPIEQRQQSEPEREMGTPI